ncbi:uncharacterized protein LOC122654075 [Telopea speciosissima]|uniref:uncharacterized protein LOC122654075 n=1 Tax=Telopea speciosissima TaxID=54955 RepID=UPI001CC53D0B|nr:uncharacterized protein LOC122654075 [Telopea speciosissima]
METEAEISEPIPSNKIGAQDKESICGESESFKTMQKVESGLTLPAKIVENLTRTEHLEVNAGTCEGESFLVSPSLDKVGIENTYTASEYNVVNEMVILQQEMLDNETPFQKDLIQEAIEETYGVTEAENFSSFVKQGPADTDLENDGELAKASELPSEEKNVEEYVKEKPPPSPITSVLIETNSKGPKESGKQEAIGKESQTYEQLPNNKLDKLPALEEMEGKKNEKSPKLVFIDQNLNLVPSSQNTDEEIQKRENRFHNIDTSAVEETSLQKGEKEEPPPSIDEGNETRKKTEILDQEVEAIDKQVSIAD